jgi:glycosyltransferase involved in cell wall biosynthesis
VEHAAGDWLAFIDHDDAWLPERLQIVVPYLTDNVDLVYTDADTIDENGAIEIRGIHARHGAGGRHPKTTVADCIYRDCFLMPGIITVRGQVRALLDNRTGDAQVVLTAGAIRSV